MCETKAATIGDRIEDAQITLTRLFHIASCAPHGGEAVDEINDLLDGLTAEEMNKIFPPEKPFTKTELMEMASQMELLSGRSLFGFLAMFEAPDEYDLCGKDANGDWGVTRDRWFYAETYDDLVEAAIAWGNARIEEAKRLKPGQPLLEGE